MKNYKIAVAGTGYVGLSIATLLSQHHQVTAVDIVPEKVELINNRKSPIQDDYIEKYLAEKELNLTATLDAKAAYSDADFVVIAAPTNYDSHTQHFDTSAVEAVIKLVMEYNPDAIMVIKSTIPVGYTASVREKFGSKNIIFSPEFLRESKALYDNLYPSRIIVGTDLSDTVMSFLCRTVFIYSLGKTYLGFSGLFQQIRFSNPKSYKRIHKSKECRTRKRYQPKINEPYFSESLVHPIVGFKRRLCSLFA